MSAPPPDSPRDSLRARLRSHPIGRPLYRVIVAVAGIALVVGGLVLVPLPGPGWLIVILGLAVLATEFAWAERLLRRVQEVLRRWTSWIGHQGRPIRWGIGLVGALGVALALYLTARFTGVLG